MAVEVRYRNVCGNFSGNVVAECGDKNVGNRILMAKGVATFHGKNSAGNLTIIFWRQQRCQHLMAVPLAKKVANTFSVKEALAPAGRTHPPVGYLP